MSYKYKKHRWGKGTKKRLNFYKTIEEYWGGSYCFLCNKEFKEGEQQTIDHLIPLCRGGTEDISNLILAHDICNKLKADMSFIKFANCIELASSEEEFQQNLFAMKYSISKSKSLTVTFSDFLKKI